MRIAHFFKKISLNLTIGIFQCIVVLKRIVFFLLRHIWRISVVMVRKVFRIPLIALYGIHFRLKSNFARLGLTIRSPFLYISLSGKTLAYLFIFGLGMTLTGVNMFLKTADIDPLDPKNIMAQYIQRDEDILTEEEEAAFTSGTTYAPFTGIQSSDVSEEEQTDITQGDIAHISDSLIKPILPMPDERATEPNKLRSYLVQEGDTVSSIAKKFGVKVQTILWANDLLDTSLLRIGQTLAILPSDGILYKIRQGDTLGKIAQQHGVDIASIISANNLASMDTTLALGQMILLPNAVRPRMQDAVPQRRTLLSRIKDIFVPSKPASAPKARGRSGFIWPTSASRITQYFSWRHPGVDIAGPSSNDIYAAAGGTIVFSGWQRGYGNTIIIDHGEGHKTRYAHASKLFVRTGETVSRGEVIAKVGSTGRSTGPHLHFEVYSGNGRINPFSIINR